MLDVHRNLAPGAVIARGAETPGAVVPPVPALPLRFCRRNHLSWVRDDLGGDGMQSVLMTGAAGGIGTRMRSLLRGVYPRLRLSDLKAPADLEPMRNSSRPTSLIFRRSSVRSQALRVSSISAGSRSKVPGR